MTRDEEKGESPLEKAAIRYAEAASEVRRLTRKLGEFDEDGPALSCSKPLVDATSQTSRACRKWTYERSDYSEGGTGDGYWESAREREEWCSACVAVQEIVDQRRAAKKKRAAALAAIGNIARGMIRRLALNGVQPVSAPVGAEAGADPSAPCPRPEHCWHTHGGSMSETQTKTFDHCCWCGANRTESYERVKTKPQPHGIYERLYG